ncbi:MAG: FtsQ-type POTRA domain-containing protein [Bacilli bacterium]|nr:FtsQ-type POTRA domain-containing protein [Bacilli bacterium]
MKEERRKRKKRKLNIKGILMLLLIITLIVSFIVFIFNIKITQIEINGTNLITDTEIIEKAQIKDYPKLFSISSSTLSSRIKELDLVNDCKVKKNLYGKLTINIDEATIIFYNKVNNKIVLSNQKEIDNSSKYLGIPTLLNYVPNDVYSSLINGLKIIDKDILRLVSEIEYSPSKTQNGESMDDERFILRMNDGNTVHINIVNIKKLNNYMDIISSTISNFEEKSGILYLDSSIEGSSYFRSYASIQREEEEKLKKEEEKNEDTKDNKPTSEQN